MSESIKELLDALKRDDVDSIISFLSNNRDLFLLAERKWGENPLLVALMHERIRVAELIAKHFNEFVKGKTKDGRTALHLICEMEAGHVPVVEALLIIDPKLCLVKDKKGMIPLHVATKNGYAAVIKALITACPESILKTTAKGETVFHLAAKWYQCNAFEVLIEEIQNLKQEYLLLRKDCRGNTVLHIATSNKLVRIVRLLLPRKSSNSINVGAFARVNSLNRKGLTALDIYYRSPRDIATREIGNLLRDAGAVEGRSLPTISRLSSTLEAKNVVIAALAIVAGAAFTTVCNLPGPLLKDTPVAGEIFSASHVMSGHLPLVLYLMVFNTALLMVCVGAINVLLWPLPFRPVVVFMTMTMTIAYALMVHSIMPKFFVRIGDHDILSSGMVAVLAVSLIGIAAIAYFFVKYIFLWFGGSDGSPMFSDD